MIRRPVEEGTVEIEVDSRRSPRGRSIDLGSLARTPIGARRVEALHP